MIRTLRPMTSFVVIVYTALACATSGTPDPEKTPTRPAPTAQALEAWLHHDPSGSEHSARYFLRMSDPQLGM